jgi:acyl-CoA thioesterase I
MLDYIRKALGRFARRIRRGGPPGPGRVNAYVSRAAYFNVLALLGAFAAGFAAEAGAAPGKSPARVLALGDSITAGYGLAAAESLPSRLEAALRGSGFAVEVINGGVSGDTTAGGLARLDWMLADRPDLVIVELGANDGLRGLDPKESFANLDKILTRLDEAKIKVLLTGMLAPPNLGAEYGREFDAIYPELAKRHGCLLYPFILDGVAAVPELNQPDGIHPNAKGVDVIVGRLAPYVTRALGA